MSNEGSLRYFAGDPPDSVWGRDPPVLQFAVLPDGADVSISASSGKNTTSPKEARGTKSASLNPHRVKSSASIRGAFYFLVGCAEAVLCVGVCLARVYVEGKEAR